MRVGTVGAVLPQWCAMSLALALGLCGCSDDNGDSDSSPNGSSGSGSQNGSGGAQHANAGSGGSTASGSGSGGKSAGTGGSSAGTGGSGQGGNAGATGSGGQGGDPDAGSGACTLACAAGKHCELVAVTCIRAPCPAQPMCVDDAAGNGTTCGTRGAAPCADGEYCDFAPGSMCGADDGGGTCKEIGNGACTKELHLVCGCDGTTYSNPCGAKSAGVSVDHEGECDGGSAAMHNCSESMIACDRGPQKCPAGEVPSVSGLCYGDCVPIETCSCDGPEDCPQSDQYTCHMAAKHCGPYVD